MLYFSDLFFRQEARGNLGAMYKHVSQKETGVEFIRKELICLPGVNGVVVVRFNYHFTGATNSVPPHICSSGICLLAGRCGINDMSLKVSVAGKKTSQGLE